MNLGKLRDKAPKKTAWNSKQNIATALARQPNKLQVLK